MLHPANIVKAKDISRCLELAILFEVSTPKPGNVNFVAGFERTRSEHFLASAVVAAEFFEEAANRGIAVADGRLQVGTIRVGEIIKHCAQDVAAWQSGGNTLLGTIMLFVPLAAAAGMTPCRGTSFDMVKLRENLKDVVESTTAEDAVNLYEAIGIAKPSGLNEAPDLDVSNPESRIRILKENVTLFEVFKIAAGYDDICSEWVKTYPISFDLAYPYLMEQLKRKDLTTAIVHTFLKILSNHPDTFIARKAGVERAREISLEAKRILQLGATETAQGQHSIVALDRKLREAGSLFNPGTTADLTATALALCTLSGYRP